MYLGDYSPGSIINYKFSTRNTGGILTTFTGGAVTIYKNSGTTAASSGVTLFTNFNSVVGLNHININTASSPSFYTTGSDFQIIVLSGSVDGISVIGETLDSFSISNHLDRRNSPL